MDDNKHRCNICEEIITPSGKNLELLEHIKEKHKDVHDLHKENPQASVGFRIEFLHLNVLKEDGDIRNQPVILGEVCEEAAAEEIIQPTPEKEDDIPDNQVIMVHKPRKTKTSSEKMDNRKRSWVWKYFHQMSNIIFRCTLCNVVLSIKGCNTNNMNRHIRTRHPAIYKTEAAKKRSSSVEMDEFIESSVPIAVKTEEICASDKDFDDSLVESPATQRHRRSWIWLYFNRISATSAQCKLCNRNIVHGGNATGNMNRHLKMIHRKTGEDHHWIWKVFDCHEENFYTCKICQHQCTKYDDVDRGITCILDHLRLEHGVVSGDQIITGTDTDDVFDEEVI
ncbi:hypothetical protein NE865_00925 [Phthorimaea operculella]|nr:hypothetical protein NE865_00925 [Phthorimaea operculella]